jgi:hypothetical protein
LLDAALYRYDATPPAEWMIWEQICGAYLAHPSRAAMHFTRLVREHTGRMSAAQLAYRRLGVFLFREAAIQDCMTQLACVPDYDVLCEISTLFPTDIALIARATEAHRMRLRLWPMGSLETTATTSASNCRSGLPTKLADRAGKRLRSVRVRKRWQDSARPHVASGHFGTKTAGIDGALRPTTNRSKNAKLHKP